MSKRYSIIASTLYVAGLLITGATIPSWAQEPVKLADPRYIEPNYIETGINYYDLDSGYSDWRGIFVRGSWQQDENNIWDAEILHQQRYDEWGTYYVAGVTHIFDPDWYGSLHIGSSDGAFFFPKIRIDAFINRKILTERNMVLTLGLGYEEAQTINSDRMLYLGASYYFETPFVLEGGVIFKRRSPGPEHSMRYRVSLLYGRVFQRYLIGEIDWGTEAYQFVAEDVSILDFNSSLIALTWREWIQRDWGFEVRGELYQSDIYDRKGIELSVFKHY